MKTSDTKALIHSVAQVVPIDAAEIVAALLDAGADRSAKLHAYGEDFDVLAMLETSAHPSDAGIAHQRSSRRLR